MALDEAAIFVAAVHLIDHKRGVLNDLGLGYLKLGQSSTTISGGEAQRVKLANELSKIKRGGQILFILDEPTTGMHLADIQRLLDSLDRLVEAGPTVLGIGHHLAVLKKAGWIIDLGLEGGYKVGAVIAAGDPVNVTRIL